MVSESTHHRAIYVGEPMPKFNLAVVIAAGVAMVMASAAPSAAQSNPPEMRAGELREGVQCGGQYGGVFGREYDCVEPQSTASIKTSDPAPIKVTQAEIGADRTRRSR